MRNRNSLQCAVILILMTASLTACDALPAAPAEPKPGATLVGTIAMDMDRAKSAQITLKVSDDGQTIESVSVTFTELKCEGFSAGSSSTTETGHVPITDGKIDFKSSNIGEISGHFTSPTAVQGTVHLAFFDGKAECGTWEWSATGN